MSEAPTITDYNLSPKEGLRHVKNVHFSTNFVLPMFLRGYKLNRPYIIMSMKQMIQMNEV